MAKRLYHKSLEIDCWATLSEPGNRNGMADRVPDPPAPLPDIRVGRSTVSVLTRCPDFGAVDLELWAGDPRRTPRGWTVAFDGALETLAQGFDLGSIATIYHVNAPPGTYRVRVESHRGRDGYVDRVRFAFLEAPNLLGEAMY